MKTKISIPGSKSYTNRALFIATLSGSKVKITNPLISDDTRAMINCLKTLGIKILIRDNHLEVLNNIKSIKNLLFNLDANESGTTIRFLLALATIIPGVKTLHGKEGLNKRPIGDLVEGLRQLGADIKYLGKEGYPPVIVSSSKLNPGTIKIKGSISSQYISAILMVAPLVGEVTIQVVGKQISKPYIDMTIDIMEKFGAQVTKKHKDYIVQEGQRYNAKRYVVEGDLSSASYFLAIAALTKSTITLEDINSSSKQADTRFAKILEDMGNKIISGKNQITIIGKDVKPVNVDMADCPDQIQTLAVLSAFAKGTTTISGVKSLRIKETDRLAALQNELEKMGIKTKVSDNTLIIHGGNPKAAVIDTYGDHRMAMSFAVAQIKLPQLRVKNPGVVSKTFPDFWRQFSKLKKIKYCLPIIKSKSSQVTSLIKETQDQFDYFEIWLDYIQDLKLDFINNLKNQFGNKLIFLFRRQNLETPKMDFKKRKDIMDAISKTDCFLDLDISQKKELVYLKKNFQTKLVLSYHNYNETPDDEKLKEIISLMKINNPDIYKISTFCKSDSDAIHLIDLLSKLKEDNLKCIVLGIGQNGIITRIAGALLGNEINFAPLSPEDKSASGQLTKPQLENILKKIRLCYFVADPVEHSMSPQMHYAGYKALGIENNFLFLRKRVSPKNLKKFIEEIKENSNFKGASISIPHKVEIMKYLDEVDEIAEKIGAVNTIVKNDKKIKGYNTDYLGILNPLKQKIILKDKKAAIIGAGGAARAAVYALISQGAKVTVFNRDVKKAKKLAHDFDCQSDPLDNINRVSDFDIVIHATKVGMDPKDKPIIPGSLVKNNQIILDVVYSHTMPETKLIKEALKAKATAISGIEMLLYQGVAQFELFTGKKAPIEAMRKALS